MSTQNVAGVTAGEAFETGYPSLANAAQGAFASGIDGYASGRVFLGDTWTFAFTGAYTPDNGQNVSVPFGTSTTRLAVPWPMVGALGYPTIRGTDAIAPLGISPKAEPYNIRISQSGDPEVSFHFGTDHARFAQNVAFEFGDTSLPRSVLPPGIAPPRETFFHFVQIPLQIIAESMATLSVGYPIPTFNGTLDFHFVDAYTLPASNRFDFGDTPDLPITGLSAGDTARLGFFFVRNTAQAFTFTGFDSSVVPHALVRYEGRERYVQFKFEFDYAPGTAQNRPFYFGNWWFDDNTLGETFFPGEPRIWLGQKFAYPFGIDSRVFGQHRMVFELFPSPSGWDSQAFGDAALYNLAQACYPAGIDALFGPGNPSLINLDQQVWVEGFSNLVTGFDPGYDSDGFIDYYTNIRYFEGFETTEWGDTWASNEIRTFALSGFHSLEIGDARCVYRQYVMPFGVDTAFSFAQKIGFTPELAPLAPDTLRLGLAYVFDPAQTSITVGFSAQQFGFASLANQHRTVLAHGITEDVVSQPEQVYNARQYVLAPLHDSVPDVNVASPDIRNQIVTLYPFGLDMSRVYAYTHVMVGKPPVYAEGVATEDIPWPSVTHYARNLNAMGFDAAKFSDAHQVKNAALGIFAAGDEALRFGTAYTWRNLRWLDPQPFDTLASGTPFVADRVRTVQVYQQQISWMGYAATYNSDQHIGPFGILSGATGPIVVKDAAQVVSKLDLGKQDSYGQPQLRNRNRPLDVFGFYSYENGYPTVELGVRYLQAQGSDLLKLGTALLSRSPRFVEVTTILGEFGHPEIRNKDASVYVQEIPIDGIDALAIDNPLVWSNSLYPNGIWTYPQFGSAKAIAALVIEPKAIAPLWAFGEPVIPHTVYVYPETLERNPVPSPSLSPQYIYAPYGIEPTPGNVIGYKEYQKGLKKAPEPSYNTWFGNHRIANFIRRYTLGGLSTFATGYPYVTDNGPRDIWVDGRHLLRVGLPEVDGGVRERTLTGFETFEMRDEGHVVASPEVVEPPNTTKTVYPSTVAPLAFGATTVEFFHRYLIPTGYTATLYGTQSWVSNEYLPFPMDGIAVDTYGDKAWVSHYVRTLAPSGIDSFSMRETFRYERLRVKEKTPLAAAGFDAQAVGTAWISHWERTLAPGHVFHHATLPRPRVSFRLSLGDISDLAFGDEGFIKETDGVHIWPQGISDATQLGALGVGVTIKPDSMLESMGDVYVANLLSLLGFESADMSIPVITGIGQVCGSRERAIPVFGIASLAVGTANVG